MPGLWFEELEVGMRIKHPLRRTLTEADNVFFTTMTLNTQLLHLDAEFSKTTVYGQRLVNSMLTLACLAGMTVNETTLGTTLGNLGSVCDCRRTALMLKRPADAGTSA